MEVRLEKASFLKALQRQQGIVERKTTVPILCHLLLKTRGEQSLQITGTDLELTLCESLACTVVKPGAVTVSAQVLYDLVRKCPAGQQISLTFDADKKQVAFACGVARFNLPTLDEKSFPEVAEHHPTHSFLLTGGELKRLVDQTRFAMSQEDARFYLNGIYLHASGQDLKAVATDAHRLALSWVPLPPKAEGLKGMILSRKTVAEMRRLIDEEETDIQASFSPTQVAFAMGDVVFYARFINGTFPQYTQAIPQDNKYVLEVDRKVFHEVVDRVSVVAGSEKTKPIKLAVQKDSIVFSARGMDNGSGTESMAIDYTGEPFEISFNARYILDAVQQVKAETFFLHFKDATTPVILKDPGDDQVLYVLMPVRS